MFTGKTNAEVKEQAAIIAASKDLLEDPKGPAETIEEAANRYRNQAFIGQEWTTKMFGKNTQEESREYRCSLKDGYLYLEKEVHGKGGTAYHYAGLMFPEQDAPKIADAIVSAARAFLKKEKK